MGECFDFWFLCRLRGSFILLPDVLILLQRSPGLFLHLRPFLVGGTQCSIIDLLVGGWAVCCSPLPSIFVSSILLVSLTSLDLLLFCHHRRHWYQLVHLVALTFRWWVWGLLHFSSRLLHEIDCRDAYNDRHCQISASTISSSSSITARSITNP